MRFTKPMSRQLKATKPLIHIEYVEHLCAELVRFSLRVKLAVHLGKLFLVQLALGTVLQKADMPLKYLLTRVLSVGQ